ncbi:MAG: GH3 auxin-responsive promoter family protein, partial [Victivallales bacterium]|nr:GH3 auxin-responsive promoter family protein [Victivallales bacterium]
MKILDELSKLGVKEAYERFERLCDDPEKTQSEFLNELLDRSADTEYGIKHGFAKIADTDSYRNQAPLTSWPDYEHYAERMGDGERDLLFPGSPIAFISTSGTSGKPKLIPESEEGALAKNITDKLRRNFTFGAHPDILQGKILPLVNASAIGETPAGIPCGTASGLTLKSAAPELLATSAYPIEVLSITDEDALDYVLTRFAVSADVRMIIGNNIARMDKLAKLAESEAERIISDIANGTIDMPNSRMNGLKRTVLKKTAPDPKRSRELRGILDSGRPFIPAEYWPNLRVVCCWLSGSVGTSVRGVKNLFSEKTEYLDYGYGASEGKFNIPRIPGKSSGTLAIHAGFYEFLPVDSDPASDADKTILAHQLREGESYRLIVTNFSGLYRYDMK